MFNPLYPFTKEVLQADIKRGNVYFVRNTYSQAFDHFNTDIKGYYLITAYNDPAKAEAHFNSIGTDTARFLYHWNNPDHQKRLEVAANNPEGYKIYSQYFLPDYKSKITNPLKDKINKYMYRHTDWKPGRGEVVNVDLFLQFGSLYVTMKYAGQEIKIKFADIETGK